MFLSGRMRHCRVSGEPMFGPRGRFLGFRGVGHEAGDTLEAKRALVRDPDNTLASVIALAGRARAQLPAASRARVSLDEVDQAGKRAFALA